MDLKEALDFSIILCYLVRVGILRLNVILKFSNSLRCEDISFKNVKGLVYSNKTPLYFPNLPFPSGTRLSADYNCCYILKVKVTCVV